MHTILKRNIDYKKVLFALLMMTLGTLMFVLPAFADAPSASTVMTNLINLMCSMFKYVGAAVFVWAVIQFILATKRSDADSKSDAVQTAVCGIALMGIARVVSIMGIGQAIDKGENDKFTDDSLTKK